MKSRYVSVSIPRELVERVNKIIKNTDLGYRSSAEFIIEAIRRRIEVLEEVTVENA